MHSVHSMNVILYIAINYIYIITDIVTYTHYSLGYKIIIVVIKTILL